jgi:hypothetical protein
MPSANFLVRGSGYSLTYAISSPYVGPSCVADTLRDLLLETGYVAFDRGTFVSFVILDAADNSFPDPIRRPSYTYVVDLDVRKIACVGADVPFYGTFGEFVATYLYR